MSEVANDHEFTLVMLAKLVDLMLRKDTNLDGDCGFPSHEAELLEMREALSSQPAVKRALLYRV